MRDSPSRRQALTVGLLFFLSGTAGLIYQVAWSRQLHAIFGVTAHAVATVLGLFLAGLALGGLWIGRRADRSPRPLALYGRLELGIAVAALAATALAARLEPLHLAAADRFGPDSPALLVVRILLAALVILPATILMGGTLPVITRAFVQRIDLLGRGLGGLYALNAAGAVAGSLAAGFLLIRSIGVTASLIAAAVLNLAVGLAALQISRSWPLRATAARPPASPAAGGSGLLAVMACAGFVTLGLEVLWTRMLMLVVGTTAYAFVTLLSTFLAGITLGAFAARRFVDRIRNPRRLLGWVQLGVAASTLATLPLVATGSLQGWLEGWGGRWIALLTMRYVASVLVMLVPTVLIGMSFPLAGRIWTDRLDTLGRRLGQVYGANALGNVLGAGITGFLLIPLVGLQRGVVVCAALSLANAAWGMAGPASHEALPRPARVGALGAAALACALLLLAWSPQPLPAHGELPADAVLFYDEGVVATVKVLEKGGDPELLVMAVDGITIGQSRGGIDAKQQALAHLPFLLRRKPPASVLSIGLGTGILIGEVARHPGVERADCVELSPAVVEASASFSRFNGDALAQPTIRVIRDDGVNFLKRSRKAYDAIISDAKSRTTHAANGTFFSSDYYELCRDHLDTAGVLVQWLPLSVPPPELRTILRTFTSVFEHAYVWLDPPHSIYLVGAAAPLVLDLPHVARQLASPAAANLRRYGWRDAHGFAGLLVADSASMRTWLSAETTINSFDHPVLEFYSFRDHAEPPDRRRMANLAALWQARADPARSVEMVGADGPTLERNVAALGLFIQAWQILERGDGAVGDALARLETALDLAPRHALLHHASVGAYRRLARIEAADATIQARLGHLLLAQRLPALAEVHFQRAVELAPLDVGTHYGLAVALGTQGKIEQAVTMLETVLGLDPGHAQAYARLGVAAVALGAYGKAIDSFTAAERLGPLDAGGLTNLARALILHPDPAVRDPQRAVDLATRALELTGGREPVLLNTLAESLAAAGRFEEAATTAGQAAVLAEAAGSAALARQCRERVVAYGDGRRYELP